MPSWSRFSERDDEGVAGTHALVIGVSAYNNLPPPDEEGVAPWELTQLDSAATAAVNFADWLNENYASGEHAPLRSMRVLLSPYAPTETAFLGDRVGDALPATRENVKAAVQAWVRDLASCAPPDDAFPADFDDSEPNGGNTSLLYVAGHGTFTGLAQRNLLLQNLEPELDLDASLDLTTTLASLAHLGLDASYSFVDTCLDWTTPNRNYGGTGVHPSHDFRHADYRRADLRLYAATAGEQAFGKAEFGSAFCFTLLEELGRAVERTPNGMWAVTPQLLAQRLRTTVHPQQKTWPEPQGRATMGFQLPLREPKGTIVVTLRPSNGHSRYTVGVLDQDFEAQFAPEPFSAHPLTKPVDPGWHTVELRDGPQAMHKSGEVAVYAEKEYAFEDTA